MIPSSSIESRCRGILIAGILIRIVVFLLLSPFNEDRHIDVVKYLDAHHRLATAAELNQSYHPPLYYLLAWSPWALTGSAKTVQLLSLLFSLLTLWILSRLLADPLAVSPESRPWCLAFAAFHPPFVMYSLYVSNDSLAFLFGALLLWAMARACRSSSIRDRCLIGLLAGLGLLTKATFLGYLPPLFLFLAWLDRRRLGLARSLPNAAAILLLAASLGSFNFIRNALLFHDPFISNIDFNPHWAELQRPVWLGIQSLLDFEIFKLFAAPTIGDATRHSIPLMLYGSFWYSFIPDSSFFLNRTAFRFLGSFIDAAALLPSLLMACAALRMLVPSSPFKLFRLCASAMLVANLLLIAAAGAKYDIWSVYQSRLFSPAFGSILVALGAGLDALNRFPRLRRMMNLNLLFLFFLFGLHLVSESIAVLLFASPLRWR